MERDCLPGACGEFIINANSSNVGVGAVLSQEGDVGEHAIAYFSQAQKKAERK